MKVQDLYATVTAQIIADLEAGVPSWTKPWKTGNIGGIMPVNVISRRAYSGINVVILWCETIRRGYAHPQWLTFKQAQQAGATIKKGSKGTAIVYTAPYTIKNEETEEEKRIKFLKTYYVFNVDQVEGLAPLADQKPLETPTTAATAFVEAVRPELRYGGDRAFYAPSGDFIGMPPAESFESLAHHDATLLHELTHWSGAKHRLDRDLGHRFGSQAYAAEELIAELGAAFLCAYLGIEGRLRHAEYINNWLQLLKADNRAIFTAAAKAQQAADYLRGFNELAEAA